MRISYWSSDVCSSDLDMRALDAERIEQAHGIRRHVIERISRFRRLTRHKRAKDRRHVRHTRRIELGRKADIAIVEADDAIAARHQLMAKIDRPHGELRAKNGRAHD